jgi:nucleoside-diphosphate-sugar epimerase
MRPDSLHEIRSLRGVETVLFAVGFDGTPGQSIEDVYAGGVGNLLSALPSGAGRFIYISTTGVYGDAGGGWVDEATPPDPRRGGGQAALDAEQVLAAFALARNSVILRLAGLYGPGRVPYLEQLRAGETIPAAGAGHINLIHVDDAAAMVVAAADLPQFDDGPHIYCVSDGHPVRRDEYFQEIARQIGAPPPRLVAPAAGSARAARAVADRRVCNDLMQRTLGVSLVYPDYQSGLAAILRS